MLPADQQERTRHDAKFLSEKYISSALFFARRTRKYVKAVRMMVIQLDGERANLAYLQLTV